jgi:polyisoprenoid-binding protein YceI
MKNKSAIIIAVIILVAASLFLFVSLTITGNAVSSPTAQVSDSNTIQISSENAQGNNDQTPIDTQSSELMFEGFALNGLKSHEGTFNVYEAFVTIEDNEITSLTGRIDSNSVNTGIERLDSHLKTDDFFNSEVSPYIILENTNIENSVLTGDITFRGQTKQISFPVETSENSISGEFSFNAREFGMKYIGVEDLVDVKFDFKI